MNIGYAGFEKGFEGTKILAEIKRIQGQRRDMENNPDCTKNWEHGPGASIEQTPSAFLETPDLRIKSHFNFFNSF